MQCNLEDLSNLWGNWYQLILTALSGIDFSLPGIIDSSLEYSDSTPVLDHQCKYSEYDLYENFWTSTCRRSWVVSPTTNRTYEYRISVIHNCKIDTALSIEVLKNGASKGPFKNMVGIVVGKAGLSCTQCVTLPITHWCNEILHTHVGIININ